MYKYQISDYFKKHLRMLLKKDPQLKNVVFETLKNFSKEQAISLGNGVYKLRIKRSGSGKSGGYRLLLLVAEFAKQIAPIYIYSKADRATISMEEIIIHLERTKRELGMFG